MQDKIMQDKIINFIRKAAQMAYGQKERHSQETIYGINGSDISINIKTMINKRISERSLCSEIYHQLRNSNLENYIKNISDNSPSIRITSELPKNIHFIEVFLNENINEIKNEINKINEPGKEQERLDLIIQIYEKGDLFSRITPDLLIHDPENNDHNICVIEVKTINNITKENFSRDVKKIKLFINLLEYKIGIIVVAGATPDDLKKKGIILPEDININIICVQ